jgi:AraC family carnitine catabolism transcriptional activator
MTACPSKLRVIDWRRLTEYVMMVSKFYRVVITPSEPRPVRRVAFLVLPEFSHFGLAAAIEPLFVANWLAQRPIFQWTIVSETGQPVRASNGMVVPVDGDLSAAADCATVFVLASFDPQAVARNQTVLRWLRRVARFGAEIGGIENGSLVLAEAGLLDGCEAAIHWDNLIGFQESYPAVRAGTRRHVRSNDRLSCAGASAILDMMIGWIGRHADPGLAGEVAEHLLLGGAQPATEMDGKVATAQAIMQEHIDEPLSCTEIASRIGLSLRQLERRFQQRLGRSVQEEYQLARLAKAHQLLQQTTLAVTEIAFACGFASPEYFSRLYRRAFGCAPSRDRRQSTTAPVLRLTPGQVGPA